MLGNVNVKLRPIKIAFLVDPREKKAVFEAIKICSFLWGGTYNPIIPVLKRVPALWKKNDRSINFRSNAKSITLGYIDTFDPDYFVSIGKCDIKHLGLDKERVISANEILENIDSDGTPSYGIGLFEILNYFIDKELKFTRRQPLNICFTKHEKKSELFLASVFGKLSNNIEKLLRDNYGKSIDAEDKNISVDNYAEILKPSTLFVRRFTSLYINARSSARWEQSACLFYLDAQSVYDIVDYWNLRAMGWSIIPIPKQSSASEATKQLARDYIGDHFGKSRHNPDIFYHTTVMKSRSVEEKEVKEFIESLNIPKPENPREYKYVFRHWYPRMWDEWARDKDGVEGCELEAGEATFDFSETDTRINAKTVDPKFVARFGGKGVARFANLLDFRIYGGKDLLAQVIPAGNGMEMVRAIGGMWINEWRFSRKELVHLIKHPKWSIYVSVPLAKDVFSGWMKSQGWEITLSSPGNIAYQMTRRLGGIHGLSILSHEGVLSLLRKMESGKVVSKDEFYTEIARATSKNRFLGDRTKMAEWLIETGMIRLGAEIQCPSCQQHPWFSIKDLDDRLQCHKCFEYFDVPAASPEKIKWAYRAFGPFSLPGRAYGVYSVLLTLRFFSQLLHDRPITPMLSFLAKKDGKEIEIDLGLFIKETRFGVTDTRLIFAECKNNDEFKKTDVDKMKWIAERFPGAILLFATLKKELSKREQNLIRPLVNKGRRQWKTELPYNPVLILTATELLSDLGPPNCWKDAGDFHESFAERYQHFWGELIPLCDITQQMYLGLKPWREWLNERRERMKKSKKVAI
ncbi:MAG: hypothetical protein WC645_02880 [Candidatus Margulisiibacteriota bacterium]